MSINKDSKYAKYANMNQDWFPALDWEDAIAKYEEYTKMPYRSESKKLPEGHIEDMDKSVRWNIQFVKDHNDAIDKENKELDKKRREVYAEAENMVKYLMCEYLDWKLSDADIDRYFYRWYDHCHSDGFRYMCGQIQCYLDEITEMDWFKKMK